MAMRPTLHGPARTIRYLCVGTACTACNWYALFDALYRLAVQFPHLLLPFVHQGSPEPCRSVLTS
jgi:hypothetical protein